MTPNRRIFLNIVATYGRSLYALVIGLFCGRWTLMALGEVDYGLVGLVGGLTAFISFVNGLLSMSVGRFYAVTVGAARKNKNAEEGIDECRKWFNTAALIHTTIPLVLVLIGYPIGEWAVRHFLTIPPDRIGACLWVWRFTCVTCFVGMITVPFNAMYTAKQEIAELTIYGFATSTLNVLLLYYMITHPCVWIVKYSLWTMLLAISPQFIIVWRALVKYPECRFRFAYLYDRQRIKDIVNFALARFWTATSSVVSAQGNAILVNKYLGPAFNASMAIGNTVASNASTLSGALSGAFWPAIANKAGEGNEDAVRQFAFKTCRFGALLILIFAIPLALEIDEVMLLWLKNPPSFVSVICVAVLIDTVLERMSEGYWMAIMGLGRRVGFYSGWVSISGFLRVAVAWSALAFGYGIYGLCIALVVARILVVGIRLVLGRMLVGMSVTYWVRSILLPICAATFLAVCMGYSVRFFVNGQSFLRLCMTGIVCEAVFLPMCWLFLFSKPERIALKKKIVGNVLAMTRKFCRAFVDERTKGC